MTKKNLFHRRTFLKSSLAAGTGVFLFGKTLLRPSLIQKNERRDRNSGVMVKVLGTAQDGGFPQMGCYCKNCTLARQNPELARKVVSLGLLNFLTKKSFMLEATPDAARQVEMIQAVDTRFKRLSGNPIDGILLTHADIGHYAGLAQFRPEITTIRHLPVYCTPIMARFLSDNEPWKFMVDRNILELKTFAFQAKVPLDEGITFEAVKVPHDKHSDMAGYKIRGPEKTLLFIPDIDRWEDRFRDIVASVDYAFVDGTFYSERRGSKIHPLIIKSMDFFKEIAETQKTAIFFIHFNHSNLLLGRDKSIRKRIEDRGFHVADDGAELWL
jgi:pyrroloquinoline quinone biosynthesis protein B